MKHMAHFENEKMLVSPWWLAWQCTDGFAVLLMWIHSVSCVKCRNRPVKRSRYSAEQAVKAVMVCMLFIEFYSVIWYIHLCVFCQNGSSQSWCLCYLVVAACTIETRVVNETYDAETETAESQDQDETEMLEWWYRDETLKNTSRPSRDQDIRDRDYNPNSNFAAVLSLCIVTNRSVVWAAGLYILVWETDEYTVTQLHGKSCALCMCMCVVTAQFTAHLNTDIANRVQDMHKHWVYLLIA